MRLKHWIGLGFVIVGILFVWHIYSSHGGVGGFKSGLGIQGV
jgi:hypothetical protein